LHKRRKAFIGIFLLAGFALYTQYEKNAEPVWKVNEDHFDVVHTLQDGMRKEYAKYEELKMLDHYDLLTDPKKTIPIKSDQRTLKVEKIWPMHNRFYILYSVDLKKQDKDEKDVPRLSVKKMRFTTKVGKKESIIGMDAIENAGQSRGIGFVFKHRLYRSTMLVPKLETINVQQRSDLFFSSSVELTDTELSTRDGFQPFANLSFKVSSEKSYEQVLESFPVNKEFSYKKGKKAAFKSYDVLLYNRQLNLEINEIGSLVGFSGWYKEKSFPENWTIVGTEEKGYSLPLAGDPFKFSEKKEDKASITLTNAIHKSEESFQFSVSKEDIAYVNNGGSIEKNEVIGTFHDTDIVYEGITYFNRAPSIIIGMLKQTETDEDLLQLRPDWNYEASRFPEEYMRLYKRNLVSLTDDQKNRLTNFQVFSESNSKRYTHYITIYEESKDGLTNPAKLPEKNLTVTLSDLIYTEPLAEPVTITYEVPNKIK
jgi:hypothetical protein